MKRVITNYTFKKTPPFDFLADKEFYYRKRKWKYQFYDMLLYIFNELESTGHGKPASLTVLLSNFLISYFELYKADDIIKDELCYSAYVPKFDLLGEATENKIVYITAKYNDGEEVVKTIKVTD